MNGLSLKCDQIIRSWGLGTTAFNAVGSAYCLALLGVVDTCFASWEPLFFEGIVSPYSMWFWQTYFPLSVIVTAWERRGWSGLGQSTFSPRFLWWWEQGTFALGSQKWHSLRSAYWPQRGKQGQYSKCLMADMAWTDPSELDTGAKECHYHTAVCQLSSSWGNPPMVGECRVYTQGDAVFGEWGGEGREIGNM